jgi:hypothetical protein
MGSVMNTSTEECKTTLKVLLSGEGPTDSGSREYAEKVWIWDDGPCQVLLRKCSPDFELDIHPTTRRELRVFRVSKRNANFRKRVRFKGHGELAWKSMVMAADKGYHVVVFFADAGKEPGTKNNKTNRKKLFEKIQGDIKIGFDTAIEQFTLEVEGISMVPVRMIEAWLVADAGAFANATGIDERLVSSFREPEALWGDEDDPGSNHPKRVINQLLDGSGNNPNRETFVSIAEEIDLNILANCCPLSARPFIDETSEALNRVISRVKGNKSK